MMDLFWTLLLLSFSAGSCLVIPISAARPAQSLSGVILDRVILHEDSAATTTSKANKNNNNDDDVVSVDVGKSLLETSGAQKTLLIVGTHCADFNMVEYAQKANIYWSKLKEQGISRCILIMNGTPSSCRKLALLLDLDSDIEILSDPTGKAGLSFGVSSGFRPDDANLSPWIKVTVVGLGLGPPWMTLPAVLPGYFGDPNGKRDWIEAGLKQGQLAGRWPAVLELDGSNNIVGNKFDDFPLFSGWGRRPFELATLRLQNLVSIQLKHWDELKPVDDKCLTQLGGCAVVGADGVTLYSWVDRGLCDVPDIEGILEALALS